MLSKMSPVMFLVFLYFFGICESSAYKSTIAKPNMFNRAMMKSASIVIASVGLYLPTNVPVAQAFGPVELTVKVRSYSQVALCNGQEPLMPGQKAMLGLFPICIEVEADVVRLAKERVGKESLTRAELLNGATLRDVFNKYRVL